MRKLQILLVLVIVCLFTLLLQSLWSIGSRIRMSSSSFEWKPPGGDALAFSNADDDYEQQTTPKLPFSLDRFGDFEPIFLAHKVIPYKLKHKVSQSNPKMSKIDSITMSKHGSVKLTSRRSADDFGPVWPLNQTRPRVANPNFGQSNNDLDGNSNQIVRTIWDRLKQMNAINPLESLRPIQLNDSQISRIYLLTYFRSGSSFLGELLQQAFRTFYMFEPLHFQTDGTRLSNHDSRLDASTRLVIDMIERCHFSNASQYLRWMSKKQNQFLLRWNRLLWSLCHRHPVSCYDPAFVTQVCQRSAHRVVKLTRLSLQALLKAITLDLHGHRHQVPTSIKLTSSAQTLAHNATAINMLHYTLQSDRTNHVEAQIGHMLNLDVPRSMPTKTLDVDSITKSSRNQHTSQVLYLVRDPRAVYASRKTLSWCANSSCSSIESLCDEMTRDFDSYESYVAARLLDRDVEDDKTINLTVARLKVRLIRFEDLALTPIQETKRLYKALGLSFTASVERYVRTHTGQGLSWSDPVLFDRNHSLPLSATLSSSTSLAVHKKRLARLAHLQLTREIRNPHSTRRESRQIPFAWHRSLRWNQVQQVQQACARVMQRLGYRVISENEFSSLNEENAVATLITKLPALSYDE